MDEKLGDPICSRFPPDVVERLHAEAAKQKRSVAQIIRFAVEEWIKNQQKEKE